MSQEKADVVVVGAGATGAAAASVLAARGLDVLVLDAGPAHDTSALRPSRVLASVRRARATRRQPVQRTHPRYFDTEPALWVDDVDHPYQVAEGAPFSWVRARQIGGRTLTWGAVTLRLTEAELRATSPDTPHTAWPLSIDELSPWYAQAESALRVIGPSGTPYSSPVKPPAKTGAAFATLASRLRARRDHAVVPLPHATRTAPDGEWPPSTANGSFLMSAVGSGRCRVTANRAVARVLVDGGRATGVETVDTQTLERSTVSSSAVVLAAGALESTRLLLLSDVDGGAALGSFLVDHITVELAGEAHLPGPPPGVRDELLIPGLSLPSSQHSSSQHSSSPHSSSPHPSQPEARVGVWGWVERSANGRASVTLIGQADARAQADSRLQLSTTLRDRLAIPAAHIDCRWHAQDLVLAARLADLLADLASELGVRVRRATRKPPAPGRFVHAAGTARMSSDPAQGVVDEWGRVHGVGALVLADGAVAPRLGWQHPTLTWIALALRAADHLADELLAAR